MHDETTMQPARAFTVDASTNARTAMGYTANSHGAGRLPAAVPDDPRDRWYRSPIVWLGAALLGASIAGCIVTVMLALGQPDASVPIGGERLMSVPSEPGR